MRLLRYKDLDLRRVRQAFDKVCAAIEADGALRLACPVGNHHAPTAVRHENHRAVDGWASRGGGGHRLSLWFFFKPLRARAG
jgi:hypothetical protein